MYNHLYYVLSRFAKKYNNRNGDFAVTAIFYLSFLIGLNVMTLLSLLYDKAAFRTHTGLMVFVSVMIPLIVNYFGLIREKKYLEIIQQYDERYGDSKLSSSAILIVLVYSLATITLAIYLATVVRAQNV